ncbi:hypothetical protein JCM11251_001279 [Rhodosporidiobolus azoricus]
MGRPSLPGRSSEPSFSPVPPALSTASSAAAGAGGFSASTPPSPTITVSPERPLPNGVVAATSSGSFRAEKGTAQSVGREETAGERVGAPDGGKQLVENGLNDLSALSSALPATSTLPADGSSAEYPTERSAVYEGAQQGYYGQDRDEDSWGAGALGMQMGGAAPVPFSSGEKRTGHCKFFNAQKGFGFVLDDQASQLGNEEVFVHYTAILTVQGGPGGFKSLLEGEAVEYDIVQSGKGWQAQNVTGPNGAPCIGTPPGAVTKAPPTSLNVDRRSSASYEQRANEFMPGRRASGLTSSMSSSNGRARMGSGYYSSGAASTTRSTYSSPSSRQVPLPSGAPSFHQSYQPVPPNFQQLVFYPYPDGSPVHHPHGLLYPYPASNEPSGQQGLPPSGGEGENGRPLQPGQPLPHPGAAYYPPATLPPGAVPIPGGGDPRFFHLPGAPPPIQTGGFSLPISDGNGQLSASPYSAGPMPYPISSSVESSSGPPSAYPISSQPSPAGQFIHPYPPPPHQDSYGVQHHPSMGDLYAAQVAQGAGGAFPIGGPYIGGDPYLQQGFPVHPEGHLVAAGVSTDGALSGGISIDNSA